MSFNGHVSDAFALVLQAVNRPRVRVWDISYSLDARVNDNRTIEFLEPVTLFEGISTTTIH